MTNNSNRIDGRKYNELRPVKFTPDYVEFPEGSVLVEMGRTRVLCNVTVEEKVPEWMAGKGVGWLTAEYAMLPRSTQKRTPRETTRPRGRTQEIKRLIGRSLRVAVDLERLGERTLLIDCDVLQADGGTRTASITGGYVAVALAVRKLVKAGLVPEDVLKPPVAAVSVGRLGSQTYLDLCYEEDHQADVDLNVIMTAEGKFIEVQGTAEGEPFDRGALDQMIDLAAEGIEQLVEYQREALENDS